jgi:hypothetical protein
MTKLPVCLYEYVVFQQKSGLTAWSYFGKIWDKGRIVLLGKKNGERMLTRRVTEKRCSSIIENNGNIV